VLTLLRAIGSPGCRLVGALVFQFVVVMALGLTLRITAFGALTVAEATALSLRFDREEHRRLVWRPAGARHPQFGAVCARVLTIDPVTATAMAGLR